MKKAEKKREGNEVLSYEEIHSWSISSGKERRRAWLSIATNGRIRGASTEEKTELEILEKKDDEIKVFSETTKRGAELEVNSQESSQALELKA